MHIIKVHSLKKSLHEVFSSLAIECKKNHKTTWIPAVFLQTYGALHFCSWQQNKEQNV